MSIRRELERTESRVLHPRAALSSRSRGRKRPEEPCEFRTAFQRDRDRILHSKSFRRLKHKTQVFLAPRGDHYRTRLTHTLEVSQIARTVARALRLNEDLTEAIALGHDLGHTPFGHAGEEGLNRILSSGFSHVDQSIRVVEHLERDGEGLNLTFEVLDGIRKHSKGLGALIPDPGERGATLEAQVVRLADIVAYLNHDIDDALRAGVITRADLPAEIIGRIGGTHSARIGHMVGDIITRTLALEREYAAMSEGLLADCTALRDFLYRQVYYNPRTHGEFLKATKILRDLFEHYWSHPGEVSPGLTTMDSRARREEAIRDFIAGMTDRFVTSTYERLFLPQPWQVL